MNTTNTHAMTDAELATVIAALRLWQRLGMRASTTEHDIATNGGEYDAIDDAHVDDLIDRMNFGDDEVKPVTRAKELTAFVTCVSRMSLATEQGLSEDWSEVDDDILGDSFVMLQSLIEGARKIIAVSGCPQVVWQTKQTVRCAIDVHGDDDDGFEVTYPAGATGTVDLVEMRHGTPVVHVVFDQGVVNVFEGPELADLSVVQP